MKYTLNFKLKAEIPFALTRKIIGNLKIITLIVEQILIVEWLREIFSETIIKYKSKPTHFVHGIQNKI